MSTRRLTVEHISKDFPIDRLDQPAWNGASEIPINKYWSGDAAPVQRRFTARLLWSDEALYARFDAAQSEPLVVNENPDLTKKALGLWDRDVCEIFVAPDMNERSKYYEFEIAPNGEWLDLAIEIASGERKTNWEYDSGISSAARIDKDNIIMAVKVPWEALAGRPLAGNIWLGNIFRCVGKEPDRGYLAWQPTETPEPNFHVLEKFGEFVFVRE